VDPVSFILLAVVGGLLIGGLARLIIPGPDPMSIFQTMLVGVAGALAAGLITHYVFDREGAPGILLSVLCAAILVFAIRKARERQVQSPMSPGPAVGGPFGSGQMHTSVHFMPGCLIFSLLASVILTIVLNLILRAL
jgi:uncharacterized membrane protein YeaQ/YmgE (transglycosylase-associated protein family)